MPRRHDGRPDRSDADGPGTTWTLSRRTPTWSAARRGHARRAGSGGPPSLPQGRQARRVEQRLGIQPFTPSRQTVVPMRTILIVMSQIALVVNVCFTPTVD